MKNKTQSNNLILNIAISNENRMLCDMYLIYKKWEAITPGIREGMDDRILAFFDTIFG